MCPGPISPSPKPGSTHYRRIRKIRDTHTPPHGHPRLTSSSAVSEKQAPAVCPSHPLFPRHHHETLSIIALPLKGRLRLTARKGRNPTVTTALHQIILKSSIAGREAEVTKGPLHTGHTDLLLILILQPQSVLDAASSLQKGLPL